MVVELWITIHGFSHKYVQLDEN